LIPEIPRDNQLATPITPDFAETVGCNGATIGPSGPDAQTTLPLAWLSAKDRAHRLERRRLRKKEAKLKRRKEKE